MGNEWTDYVQQLVDFAHAFPRFSVMNNKSRPCIPEFLPNIFRVLEGLAAYPTVMRMELVFVLAQIFLRKLDFAENGNLGKKGPILCKKVIFLSFGDIFIFPNVCAIQTNLDTKDFFEKKLC